MSSFDGPHAERSNEIPATRQTAESRLNECLADVHVLELGSGFAASYCAYLLGSMGARVTKIAVLPENAHTGSARVRHQARSSYVDREKHLIVGDLTERELVLSLQDTDVVIRGIECALPGQAQALAKEYQRWRAIHPALVYAAITPFGTDGPNSLTVGTDINAQAMSGWSVMMGNPDEPPLTMTYDIAAAYHGLVATGAILSALHFKSASGVGDFVDVSEAEVLAASIRTYSVLYRWYEIPLRRAGHRAPGSSGRYPCTVLPCRDGSVVIMCRTNDEWQRFVEMMGNPSWASLPRYQDYYRMAIEYPDEVDSLIAPWLLKHSKDELRAAALKHRIPLAPINSLRDVLEDTQLIHRGFFRKIYGPNGEARVPSLPAKWKSSRLYDAVAKRASKGLHQRSQATRGR
jgi:crotonobetainyl-CoA:carnitine CoA-transferase CaiB-like acyl-CoA transferase